MQSSDENVRDFFGNEQKFFIASSLCHSLVQLVILLRRMTLDFCRINEKMYKSATQECLIEFKMPGSKKLLTKAAKDL